MTDGYNPLEGLDLGRLADVRGTSIIDTAHNAQMFDELEKVAREKRERAEGVAADTSLTAQALVQLNEHQQKLNDKQRVEQKVQRRIARLQAMAIRRYNLATIWLSAIAALGTGFAVAELGRTFGWW